MIRSAAFLLILAVTVNGDFFDDVKGMTSDVGDFFNKQFQNAKDLFANNQDELDKNINRVKDLLTAIKEKADALKPIASDTQKATLAKVDEYLKEVESFKKEAASSGQEKFEQTKTKWQELVDKIFNSGGLKDLMKILNVQNAASMTSVPALLVCAVVAYAI